jgi:hypothetical protein
MTLRSAFLISRHVAETFRVVSKLQERKRRERDREIYLNEFSSRVIYEGDYLLSLSTPSPLSPFSPLSSLFSLPLPPSPSPSPHPFSSLTLTSSLLSYIPTLQQYSSTRGFTHKHCVELLHAQRLRLRARRSASTQNLFPLHCTSPPLYFLYLSCSHLIRILLPLPLPLPLPLVKS